MNVLIFASQFDNGALEILQRHLANDLKEIGVDVFLLNMYSKSSKESSKNKCFFEKKISKRYFLDLPLHPNLLNILFGIIKLKLILKKEKIDIVETSTESLSILTSIATLGTNTHHIIGIHKTYKRKSGYRNGIRENLLKIFSKLNKKTSFYAVSEWAKKSWINFSNTKNNKIKVIYNCIDLKENIHDKKSIKQKLLNEFNIPEGSKIILSIGRICSHKNQDFLIKSLGSILRKEDYYIILVGDIDIVKKGSDQTINKINVLIKKYDIKPFVKFAGYRKDIKELMLISDVFVHASLSEAFGLVLIEAMSMGLPIVSSKTEAIPEFIYGPGNFLIEENDLKSFRTAVKKVLSTNANRRKYISIRNKNIGKSPLFYRSTRAKNMYKLFKEVLKVE